MKKFLSEILQTSTFKQSSITFGGTFLNGLLGALFYITTARVLGPSEFGVLIISITVLTLIADIVDLGTNAGLLRFVPAVFKEQRSLAYKYLKLALETKVFVWVISMFFGWTLIPLLSEILFHKTELIGPLRLALVGVGGALLFSFSNSTLQALERFSPWAILNVSTNLLRILLFMLLVTLNLANLTNSLLIYIVIPFLGFFLSLSILPLKSIINSKGERSLIGGVLSYNRWVAMFTLIVAFSSRLDIFLNARLLSSYEVGIYGAATQLTSFMPQLVSALGIVAAPKFASFTDQKQMLFYFKKLQLFVGGISLLLLLILPLSKILIPIFFGGDYLLSITPFIILFLAMLVFLLSLPTHMSIFYYFSRPDIFVWVSLGHLIIVGGVGFELISRFSVTGAAITVLLGMIFNFLVPFIWFIRRLKN